MRHQVVPQHDLCPLLGAIGFHRTGFGPIQLLTNLYSF
jgi:hypothetical protein